MQTTIQNLNNALNDNLKLMPVMTYKGEIILSQAQIDERVAETKELIKKAEKVLLV